MKTVALKESRAPYTVTLDDEALADEAVLVSPDGKPLGVLIPIADYDNYKAWRAAQKQSSTSATATTFEIEQQTYERLKPELLKQYTGRAVAIRNDQLLEVGTEGERLADFAVRVYRRVGYAAIYFDVVEETPRTYKVPYFKVRR